MNKKLETQLNEIAEFNIPDDTNIWPSLKVSINNQEGKFKSRPKINFLRPSLIAFTLLFAISNIPSVHAKLEEIIESIGGVFFEVTGEFPDFDGAITIPSESVPIEKIRAQYPFDLPTFTPKGYILEANATVTSFYDFEPRPSLTLKWDIDIPATGYIWLRIHHNEAMGGEPVGPDSLEMIEIGGYEMALITGSWYGNTNEWNYDICCRLKWEKDDLLYDLSYPETVPFEEIIKMVETMLESTE